MKESKKLSIGGIMAGLLFGALLCYVLLCYLEDRVNARVAEISPNLVEIMEVKDQPDVIRHMIEQKAYNEHFVLWALHLAHLNIPRMDGQDNDDQFRASIIEAVRHLNGYDLYHFVTHSDEYVLGLTEDEKEAYAKVGLADYDPQIKFTPAFVEAWKTCETELTERFEGPFAQLYLIYEFAFGLTENVCPNLESLRSSELLAHAGSFAGLSDPKPTEK